MAEIVQLAEEKSRKREAEIMADAREVYARRSRELFGEVIRRAGALKDAALGASILRGLENQLELSLELISREEKGGYHEN